ncbi:MAG: UvrD-helicase domain-containing protein, partial [Hyphomicrobiaceae bacterium]
MTVNAAQLETNANQSRAANPMASAWVSANAGTGKTYVLTRRVLRLLLNGTAPDQILCLTYTKAAAAEMSRRVFDELAEWAVARPDALAETLTDLEDARPDAAKLAVAPTLFARAIETPGGLKVQTIHAFCERLLQRFPLEAGVAPDFGILDEDEQKELLAQSIDQVLSDATDNPGGPLHEAMTRAVRYAADDSFDQLLGAILGKRETLMAMVQAGETEDDPIEGIAVRLKASMDLPEDVTLDTINAARAGSVDAEFACRAATVLAEGTKTDTERADLLNAFARSADGNEKIAVLTSLFLTATGGMRKSLITKKPATAHPDVEAGLVDAQQTFAALTDQAGALSVIEATTSIIRLADAIFTRYTDAKRRHAALDYDDLIMKTVALVSNERDAQWVLYKLDNGLEHILVDEAQDTSPIQWRIVSRLAEEFFSGIGVSEKVRTLFAVGDEKQSIYGFQGARPEMFAEMGKR